MKSPLLSGLAYVQYTHEHKIPPIRGSLIRVLQGFYESRLSDEELAEIVKKPHRFQRFCPVYRSVNVGFFELVGNFPVPDFAQKFSVMTAMKMMTLMILSLQSLELITDTEQTLKKLSMMT